MLPWLPSLLLIGVVAYQGNMLTALRGAMARRGRAVLSTVLWCTLSLPQFLAAYLPESAARLFSADAACPRTPYLAEGPAYYYHCINHYMWGKPSFLWSVCEPLADVRVLAVVAGWVLAVGGLLQMARRQLGCPGVPTAISTPSLFVLAAADGATTLRRPA
jgi:hypothetical protein